MHFFTIVSAVALLAQLVVSRHQYQQQLRLQQEQFDQLQQQGLQNRQLDQLQQQERRIRQLDQLQQQQLQNRQTDQLQQQELRIRQLDQLQQQQLQNGQLEQLQQEEQQHRQPNVQLQELENRKLDQIQQELQDPETSELPMQHLQIPSLNNQHQEQEQVQLQPEEIQIALRSLCKTRLTFTRLCPVGFCRSRKCGGQKIVPVGPSIHYQRQLQTQVQERPVQTKCSSIPCHFGSACVSGICVDQKTFSVEPSIKQQQEILVQEWPVQTQCSSNTCQFGSVCMSGVCVQETAVPVTPSTQTVVEEWTVQDKCSSIRCPGGSVCVSGACIEQITVPVGPSQNEIQEWTFQNECSLIRCHFGSVCKSGVCVEDTTLVSVRLKRIVVPALHGSTFLSNITRLNSLVFEANAIIFGIPCSSSRCHFERGCKTGTCVEQANQRKHQKLEIHVEEWTDQKVITCSSSSQCPGCNACVEGKCVDRSTGHKKCLRTVEKCKIYENLAPRIGCRTHLAGYATTVQRPIQSQPHELTIPQILEKLFKYY